jgi:hypothetical protein
LSIDSGRCLALDNPDLQDNPKVWWDEAAITAVVKDYVSKWKVDVVSDLSRDWEIMLTLGTRSSHLIAAAYPATLTIEQ